MRIWIREGKRGNMTDGEREREKQEVGSRRKRWWNNRIPEVMH